MGALDPYILPEGNVQIAFSGGRTSAYMLHQILEANSGLPDRAKCVFANTGREMNGTLDFVQECADRWGVKIEWVQYRPDKPWFEAVNHNSAARDGEPFADMIRHKRYVPNGRKRICTEQLKVRAARRMLVASGWRNWTKALGIRADESDRHDMPDQPREAIWMPLVADEVTKAQVLKFWAQQPFDLPAGTISNCKLCFQFSRAKLAFQMLHDPADKWPEQMEATGFGTFLGSRSWADFRDVVERQGDLLIDWRESGGRSCGASNDGECTG